MCRANGIRRPSPFPSKPPAYDVQSVNADTIIDFTPELHAKALELISHYNTGGIYDAADHGDRGRQAGARCARRASRAAPTGRAAATIRETHTVYVFSQTTIAARQHRAGTIRRVSDFEYVRGTPGEPLSAACRWARRGRQRQVCRPAMVCVPAG